MTEFKDITPASGAAIAALKKIRDNVFHEEQLIVWSDEFLADISPYVGVDSYDDGVDLHERVKAFLTSVVLERIGEELLGSESDTGECSDEHRAVVNEAPTGLHPDGLPSLSQAWPLVDENDDGIRPAGKPDACFYCGSKVGMAHDLNCVCVTKAVKVRYSFEIEVKIPYSWSKDNFEFHRNEGSWCSDNALGELEEFSETHGCLCNVFTAEFLEVIDDTPQRALNAGAVPKAFAITNSDSQSS